MRALSKIAAVLVIVAAMASPGFGFDKKKKAPPPAPETHATHISSVAADAITIADNKTTKTLTVTQFTEITVNGQKATVAELKPGMTVSITLGTDPTRASRIIALGK